MNKKFMSFVLAMVLSVGLGVSALFAYSYSHYATEFNSYYSGSTSKGSVTLTILDSDSADKVLQGNLTAVFGYYAGTLLSYQAAGGQFQLYDSYGARFTCNNDGGIWTLTGANFRSSDLNELMKYDTMEDFLMSFGFSEESLSVTEMDEDGNIVTTTTYGEDGYYGSGTISKEEYDKLTEEEKKYFGSEEEYGEDGYHNGAGKTITKAEYEKLSDEDKKKYSAHKKGDKYYKADKGKIPASIYSKLSSKAKEAFTYHKADDKKAIKDLTDEEVQAGYTVSKTKISGDLYSKLIETLSSGVNFSASVSVGSGVTGPSLTVSENGKAQITYTSDPTTGGIRPISMNVYDDNGFQIGVQTATFELDSTENGAASGHWTCNYTSITYDKNGVRTDTAYQFYSWSSDPVATINSGKLLNDIPDDCRYEQGYYDSDGNMITEEKWNSLSKEEQKKYSFKAGGTVNEDKLREYMDKTGIEFAGQISSVTHYSANNSALYSYDYTTNQTTYFANNKPSYVVNAQGETVGLYSYSENGVMTAYFNANGTDTNGNKVGTTTIFDQWGRQLFTAVGGLNDGSNPFKDQNARAELMAEYEAAIADGQVDSAKFKYNKDKGVYEAVEGTGTRITTISIYTDQLFNKNSEAYSQFTTNGFLDMKKVQAALNGLNTSGLSLAISAIPTLADGLADVLSLSADEIKKLIAEKKIDLDSIEGLTDEQKKKIKANPTDSSKWGLSTALENQVLSAMVKAIYGIDISDSEYSSIRNDAGKLNTLLNQLISKDLTRIDISGLSLSDTAQINILSAVVAKLYNISKDDLKGLTDKKKLALLTEITQDAHSIVIYCTSSGNEFGFNNVGSANTILNKITKKLYGIDINSDQFKNLNASQKHILLNRILNNAYSIDLTDDRGTTNYTGARYTLNNSQKRHILTRVVKTLYGINNTDNISTDNLVQLGKDAFGLDYSNPAQRDLMNLVVKNLYGIDLNDAKYSSLSQSEKGDIAKGFLSIIGIKAASYTIDMTGTNSHAALKEAGLQQSDATQVDNIMNKYLPAVDKAMSIVYGKVMDSVGGDSKVASALGTIYAGLARVAADGNVEASIAIDIAAIRRGHADTGITTTTLNGYKASLKTTVASSAKTASGAVSALKSEFNWQSILANNSGASLALLNCLNTNLFKLGYTVNDFANMLSFSNGGATAVAQTTIAMSTWDGDNIPGMDGVDGSADYSDVDYHSVTETNGNVTAENHGSHVQWSVKNKKTNSRVAAAGVTFTNTIMLGGAQAYSTQHNVVTDVYEVTKITVSTESDPVVEGTLFPEVSDEELEANGIDPNDKEAVAEYKQKKLETVAESLNIGHYDDEGNFVVDDEEAYENLQQGFYVKDGKTYAVVNAASINMMDGEGFQAAEGELVFVEIDEETKNSIIENGSKTIMFMGNVSASVGTDSSGQPYLTMVMDKSYSGGYKQGAEAVQNAKNEIFLTSIGAALNNGMSVEEVQAKIDAYNEANGTEFTAAQATERYESNKTEGTEYNWAVKNTNDNMTLFGGQSLSVREAWGLLFNGDANSYQKQQNKRIMAAARSNDFSLDVLF